MPCATHSCPSVIAYITSCSVPRPVDRQLWVGERKKAKQDETTLLRRAAGSMHVHEFQRQRCSPTHLAVQGTSSWELSFAFHLVPRFPPSDHGSQGPLRGRPDDYHYLGLIRLTKSDCAALQTEPPRVDPGAWLGSSPRLHSRQVWQG